MRTKIDFNVAAALLEQKKKEKSDGGGGGGTDKRWARMPDMGELKVRFLPPYEGDPVPGLVIHKHYGLPKHEKIPGNITCFKTWGLDCPICRVIDEYKDRTNLDDFTGTSAYFNVLVLESKEHDPTLPYILQASGYTYEWLLQQVLNAEVGDITDVEDGANVTFVRRKKKGAFDRIISRKSSSIADSPEKIDKILGEMYDIKKIWRNPDDNYFNIADDLAKKLRDIIEDRLIRLGSNNNADKAVREVQEAKRRQDPERVSREEDEEAKRIRDERESQALHAQKALKMEEEEKKKEDPPVARRRTVRDVEEEPQKKEGDTAIKKTKSSPDCFGKEHNAIDRKCQICQFEFDCDRASK
jgi:hypothetical protein